MTVTTVAVEGRGEPAQKTFGAPRDTVGPGGNSSHESRSRRRARPAELQRFLSKDFFVWIPRSSAGS
jgi:hypothetical protein